MRRIPVLSPCYRAWLAWTYDTSVMKKSVAALKDAVNHVSELLVLVTLVTLVTLVVRVLVRVCDVCNTTKTDPC